MEDLFKILNTESLDSKLVKIALYTMIVPTSYKEGGTMIHKIVNAATNVDVDLLSHTNCKDFLDQYVYNEESTYDNNSGLLFNLDNIETYSFEYWNNITFVIDSLNDLLTNYNPEDDEANKKYLKQLTEDFLSTANEKQEYNKCCDLTNITSIKDVKSAKCYLSLPLFINDTLVNKKLDPEYNLFGEFDIILPSKLTTLVSNFNSTFNSKLLISKITMLTGYLPTDSVEKLCDLTDEIVLAKNAFYDEYMSKLKMKKKDVVTSSTAKELGTAKLEIKNTICSEFPQLFKNSSKVQSFFKINLTEEERFAVDINPIKYFYNTFDNIYKQNVKFNIPNIISVLELNPDKYKVMLDVLYVHVHMTDVINLDCAEYNNLDIVNLIVLLLKGASDTDVIEFFKDYNIEDDMKNVEGLLNKVSIAGSLHYDVRDQIIEYQVLDYYTRLICASVMSAVTNINTLPIIKK